jgi:CHAT domain-containing protein/tetratricopeptide (TPR) repeat protein
MEMDRTSRSAQAKGPADPLCPDPEILAAWVDQGLEAADRARIDTHLAGCDDCRLLVARVIEFQHAAAEDTAAEPAVDAAPAEPAREPQRAAVLPFTRRVTRWHMAAFATAAAALLLAVQVAPVWGPGGRSGADSRLADLADAVGQVRTVEARLTGGFRYGPLRAPLRSGGSAAPMDNWTLYAAAGKIREEAQKEPTADNLHGLGLAHLVVGNYDDAVQALEDAVAEAPQVSRYQSDLAAAYLARGKELDRPDDAPRALAAAERAIAADDTLEARYNRALALQTLFLEDQARQAWDDYLKRDSTSEWAEEARRYLAALQRSANDRNDLARNNSPPPITDRTVEPALDWIVRTGLPAWADAVLAGDSAAAARQHTILQEHAQQVAARSGDPFARALTALPPADSASAPPTAALARAIARALAAIDEDDLAAAERTLREACTDVTALLAPFCDLELGPFDVLQRKDAAARERIARIEQRAAGGLLYLQTRAARLAGYRALFIGDYAASLRENGRAYELAQRGKYLVQGGVMAVQLASLYDVIGQPLDAWRWRRIALQATRLPGSAIVRSLVAVATANTLSREANFEAARAFLTPPSGADSRPRLQQVPPLLSQTRAALAAGDLQAASEALDAGTRIVSTVPDVRAALMKSEVLALQASLAWARRDLSGAEQAMDAALAAMGPERSARRAAALLERARIRADAGADIAAAQRDLDEASTLLQSRGLDGAQPLPADDTRLAFGAIAALVEARADLQGPAGLALNENFRLLLTGVLPGEPSVTARTLEDAAARLDPGIVGVVFLFGSKGLMAWTLSGGGIHFRQLPIARDEVDRLVAALAVQLARSPLREDTWKALLAELYAELLAGMPGIDSAAQIVIVPDGPLRRVPFGSLVEHRSGAFLFDRASVRIVPSLMFGLRPGPPRPAQASLLAIGEPDVVGGAAAGFSRLPNARAEATDIARLYKRSTTLIGAAATKQALLAELPQTDVLHFAGHALGGTSGAPPRLLLAGTLNDPAATLSLADLTNRLRGARVVLAACETAAAARTDRSVGAADLAGGFLRAGAASVVATLWKIDDVGGQAFFTSVHRGLAQGQTPAAAVAAAQRHCRSDERCRSHPVTWIGTTVYGVD